MKGLYSKKKKVVFKKKVVYVKDSDSSTIGTCPIDLKLTIFLVIILRDRRGFNTLATLES